MATQESPLQLSNTFPGYDPQLVADAVVESSFPALAKEAANELIDKWLEDYWEADSTWSTLGVELGFGLWIEPSTLVVGYIDRVCQPEFGLAACEWKTTRPEKGWWWNEEKWLEEIREGSQIVIYAAALADHRTRFLIDGELTKSNPFVSKKKDAEEIHVLVRAAVKSSPPKIWPTDPNDGIFTFRQPDFTAIKNVLALRAEAIRVARARKVVPWDFTGRHCKPYKEFCPYHDLCSKRNFPEPEIKSLFDESDPGNRVVEELGFGPLDVDPRLVILSASSFETSRQCMEKYRLVNYGLVEKEQSMALSVGGAFHVGVAAAYRQNLRKEN